MIVTESSGRWARAREFALPSPRQGYLASIDCTGPGSCVAAGDYIVPAGNSFTVEPDAADCSGSGFCAVVGSYFTTAVNSEAAMAALAP